MPQLAADSSIQCRDAPAQQMQQLTGSATQTQQQQRQQQQQQQQGEAQQCTGQDARTSLRAMQPQTCVSGLPCQQSDVTAAPCRDSQQSDVTAAPCRESDSQQRVDQLEAELQETRMVGERRGAG